MSSQRSKDISIATRTLMLAKERGMDKHPRTASGTCSTHYHHLEGMLHTMKHDYMDDSKRGRFIGWMQCAVTTAGYVTMEEFRELNRSILNPENKQEPIVDMDTNKVLTTDEKVAMGLGVRGSSGQFIANRDW